MEDRREKKEIETVHVMSDDVGRHNIKIYEAFNKFSFAWQLAVSSRQSPVDSRQSNALYYMIRVGVSTEKCCLVNSFGRHRPSRAISVHTTLT